MKKLISFLYGSYFNILELLSKKRVAKKAFNLFCTIRKGSVLPHQIDFLDNAKHELIEIAKHGIQTYNWPGTKETILLIHGWESNTFRWRNLVEKLKEQDFNIIAFDAPGHGHSSGQKLHVPLYSEVLQYLIEKHKPQSLVGHSLGGMTIIYNEHKNKNTAIEKIITVASPSEFHELMEHFQKLLKFNSRVMSALDAYIFNSFGFYIREFSTSEYVKTNTTAGLLFHDHLDKITPYSGSQKVHANWKNSTFISTEGYGHSMHQDDISEQMINFLNS